MGLIAVGGVELSDAVVQGAFVAAGNSGNFSMPFSAPQGRFNVSLWGAFTGTVILERSFDAGATFLPVALDSSGTPNAYTAPMSVVVSEPEAGVLYRLRCSTFTAGPINYRMSSGRRAA